MGAPRTSAGDVIVELQATGPAASARVHWDDVFGIRRPPRGHHVVEGCNGNRTQPAHSPAPAQKFGAIVVGAGIRRPTSSHSAPAPARATRIGVPRSRIWFPNYGLVNVHGWGWHVTTCGYGDAQGGASENRWYTHRFSGTSSASPIVTGAVAVLQGISKVRNGGPLTPARVRAILMLTGTPQVAGPGVPLSQRIGPLPNLAKAQKLV
jgi:hypothetical protein